jgi:hypothetical protein
VAELGSDEVKINRVQSAKPLLALSINEVILLTSTVAAGGWVMVKVDVETSCNVNLIFKFIWVQEDTS